MTVPIVPGDPTPGSIPQPTPPPAPQAAPPPYPAVDQQGNPGFWVWQVDHWVWQPQPQPSWWTTSEGIVVALMIAGTLAFVLWITYRQLL